MIQKDCWYIENGVRYRKSGWHGCQLKSYEYKRQNAGTRRTLETLNKTYEIILFATYSRPLFSLKNRAKVEHSWSIKLSPKIDEANAQIREFYNDLDGVY